MFFYCFTINYSCLPLHEILRYQDDSPPPTLLGLAIFTTSVVDSIHDKCNGHPMSKISESEWTVMEALWESSPQTAGEVTRVLRPTTNWAENTVRTMLARLVDKGALETGQNDSGTRTFSPALSRESCVKAEGDSFMQRIFRGSAKPLLVHFAQESKFSAEEVDELKRLLDESVTS